MLAAATALFLEQGFGRTTLDQVAETAHTGKTTLYGRYPTKEALFAAVVHRYVDELQAKMAFVPAGGTLRERLVQVGVELAEFTLTPESIALMRLTFAETVAFPELGREGFRIGFGGCVRCVAECLAEDGSEAALEAATPMATRFVEMALHPLYMHAFSGADLAGLRERAARDVAEVTEILLGD
ncbi:TetR/AcrR family transcriptional regulator [Methylorubrum populi]|nr:TetR/AcrR family transcriptional regulator [Methylorubrum rhodesianum]MBY0142950.1 TetR/AcrR family transcriptional regulator [Methylorubrum populi]